MTELPIFVAGLGRCGSSLVLQMLEAGGIPCLGPYPAFEPECVGLQRDPFELLKLRGVAAKIIDPEIHEKPWPKFDAKIIWLNRNPKQQAKSQIKFACKLSGMEIPSGRSQISLMASALKRDKFKCCEWWNRCQTEPLFLSFEELLAKPSDCAANIVDFIGAGELGEMVNCVVARKPECASGLDMEDALMQSAIVAERFGVSKPVALRRLLNG